MQGITKLPPLETPWLDRMNRKTIPQKPATQSEVTAVVAVAMADCREKGYDAAELDRLYRELTGHDPKPVDRTQFNYGRCLPWKTRTETPAEYLRTEHLRRAVQERSEIIGNALYNLTEALRDVRTADNDIEYQTALAKLKAVRAANDVLGIDATYNQANMPGNPAEWDEETQRHIADLKAATQ